MGIKEFLFGEDVQIPEMMDFDVAFEQAEQVLQPKLNQQMNRLQNRQMQRGFYGQVPGDVMQNALKSQQTSQVADYANQMRQRDFQNALQTYQFKRQDAQGLLENPQFWNAIGSITGQLMASPAGSAFAGSLSGGGGGGSSGNTGYTPTGGGYNPNRKQLRYY